MKRLLVIVTAICLVAGIGCAGIVSLASGNNSGIVDVEIDVNDAENVSQGELLTDSEIERLAELEKEEKLTGNLVIIYYVGYNNPYIHYKIDGASWTQSPGVAMEKSYLWYNYGYRYRAVIDLGEAAKLTACFNDGGNSWDNNGGSNYTFAAGTYSMMNGVMVQHSGEINVADYVDTTTIYYKGYSNPYVHYNVNKHNWTTTPGVQMIQTDELEGYTHKIVIDSVDYGYVELCFNDGNGSWDSKDGSNYKVGKGTYTFNNGTFEQINDVKAELRIDIDPTAAIAAYAESKIETTYSGGVGPYIIEMGYEKNIGTDTPCVYTNTYKKDIGTTSCTGYFSFSFYGSTRFFATITDSEGNTAECETYYSIPEFEVTGIATSVESPQLVNTEITLETKHKNHYLSRSKQAPSEEYSITREGYDEVDVISNNPYENTSAVWTPTKAGKYYIHVEATSLDCTSSYDITYDICEEIPEIPEPTNTVTIYYNGYSTSYIHYRIDDGAWTMSPGVKMSKSDKEGYSHMYVIDLKEGTRATACFNNGASTWDNNCGQDYSFKAGVYGVSYSRVIDLQNPEADNIVTIYYKGYSNPYIHYKIGTGCWTTAPGVLMDTCNDMTGYTHKITINLGKSDYLTTCFNDGNGSWDSNNGNNYKFYVGTYLYSNGTITEK